MCVWVCVYMCIESDEKYTEWNVVVLLFTYFIGLHQYFNSAHFCQPMSFCIVRFGLTLRVGALLMTIIVINIRLHYIYAYGYTTQVLFFPAWNSSSLECSGVSSLVFFSFFSLFFLLLFYKWTAEKGWFMMYHDFCHTFQPCSWWLPDSRLQYPQQYFHNFQTWFYISSKLHCFCPKKFLHAFVLSAWPTRAL